MSTELCRSAPASTRTRGAPISPSWATSHPRSGEHSVAARSQPGEVRHRRARDESDGRAARQVRATSSNQRAAASSIADDAGRRIAHPAVLVPRADQPVRGEGRGQRAAHHPAVEAARLAGHQARLDDARPGHRRPRPRRSPSSGMRAGMPGAASRRRPTRGMRRSASESSQRRAWATAAVSSGRESSCVIRQCVTRVIAAAHRSAAGSDRFDHDADRVDALGDERHRRPSAAPRRCDHRIELGRVQPVAHRELHQQFGTGESGSRGRRAPAASRRAPPPPPTTRGTPASTSGSSNDGHPRLSGRERAERRADARRTCVGEPGSIDDERSSLGGDRQSDARQRRSGSGGRPHSSRACVSIEVKAGSTGRPSGPAAVTSDSSCVLSTSCPCAPTPSSPRVASSGSSSRASCSASTTSATPTSRGTESADRLDHPRRRRCRRRRHPGSAWNERPSHGTPALSAVLSAISGPRRPAPRAG